MNAIIQSRPIPSHVAENVMTDIVRKDESDTVWAVYFQVLMGQVSDLEAAKVTLQANVKRLT